MYADEKLTQERQKIEVTYRQVALKYIWSIKCSVEGTARKSIHMNFEIELIGVGVSSTSYLVVFGAPSRMVKVRGACDKPCWTYKRLNNCATPAPGK